MEKLSQVSQWFLDGVINELEYRNFVVDILTGDHWKFSSMDFVDLAKIITKFRLPKV